MGVFARFLRKKAKATEEPDTEASAGTEPDGPVAEDAVEAAAKGSGEDDGGSADAETEPSPPAVTAAENTEIPQQQSAKEAADNEAGEGART